MRPRGWTALAVLSVVLLSAPSGAKEIDRDFHQSFEVGEGVRLDLRHGDGDVTIEPWDKDVIDVTVRYRADVARVGFGGDPDFDVEFTEGDDFVRVVGRTTPVGPSVFLIVRRYEYSYTISAPPYVKLDIEGDDGDIEISGWRAEIDCMIDDGDVALRDVDSEMTRLSFEDGDISISGLSGDLRLSGDDGDVHMVDCLTPHAKIEVFDGDVTASRCRGEFSVEAEDGDVMLDLMQSSTVRVRVEDGDVDIELGDAEFGDIDVGTEDGDVAITLQQESSFSFLITMDDGDVRVEVPDRERFEESEHSVSGVIRGGRGYIRIRTEDGNVLLREAG